MKTIWKYTLPARVHSHELEVPAGSRVLSAHRMFRHGREQIVSVWMLVDPERKPETRRFRLVTTGQELTDDFVRDWSFITTLPSFVHETGREVVVHVWMQRITIV